MNKFTKITAVLVFSAITALSACACGGNNNNASSTDNGASVSDNVSSEPTVEGIVSAISAQYPLDSMTQITNADKLLNTYGFAPTDYSEIAVYTNNTGTEVSELFIIKATDETTLANIQEKLNNELNSKLNQTKDYLPEQYAIVEKCEVGTNGKYVRLIISPDADKMVEIFNSQFN